MSTEPTMQDDNAPAPSSIQLPAQNNSNSDGSQLPQTPQPQSRLAAVLTAVAKTVSTGLSAIPNQGRPSVVTGLGQGARAEQAAEATENQIKMQDFENSVRLANLHNTDLELQHRTQEQQDAHQRFQDFQNDYDEEHGISHDTVPNDANAVIQHLQAQTATNGTSSVPPGTHLSADGKTVNVPSQDPDTQKGLMQKYNDLAPGVSLHFLGVLSSFRANTWT
jgi:hypothetical protein